MPLERITLLTARVLRVEEVRDPDAGGHVDTRQVVRHPGAVAIVPMVDDDHVCLIRNYRVAAERTLIEIPAGTLAPNEPPEKTAGRELIEETGYVAGRIEKLHT